MRALQNTKSKQFFKKYEKPKQTQESIMNTIEAKKIATVIGIDLNEIKNLGWFFQLISKIKLPSHYRRQLTQDKDDVIYLNQLTHEESTDHPSLNLLKIIFYECLENNKSVYTFVQKQAKLLPFVEEKMLRQCIGLSSKRRDAEKVNLQRDENGKMVMSKLQRINPDIKNLLSGRSYMLKMLVQKVFTRKQILGKGKRVGAYQNVISEVKKLMKQLQPDNDQQIETDDDLQKYQKVFIEAASYYQSQYGNLEKIPLRVVNSKQYIESTPQNVLKNIFLLNIDKDNIELYWLARIMDCLPLPHSWSKKKGISFDSYIYEPEKILFDIHPSYVYILYQMNKFKSIFKQLGAMRQNYYYSMRQLTFFDFFQRAYTVDMYGYIQKNTKKVDTKKTKRNLDKHEQVSDWMILEGLKNSPINNFNLVLLEHIQSYWNSLNFKAEPWSPSISPFGQVVWSSNINEKSMSFNPYKPKLTSIVNSFNEKLPTITDDILKKQYKEQIDEQSEYLLLDTDLLIKQREDFLEYYLNHEDKAVPWPYELKSRFQQIDENIFYEQIFVSPFELDKGVLEEGEQVPFWLEKCRAKKHTIDHTNLLLFNPEQFTSIKQKISNYALEMVGQHEPHLLEQTEKKINRISNSQELIKYLNYINDLDMRQQRKKQYLDSMKIDSDSDIFGSDISQVQLNEQMGQQSVHEEQISEREEISQEESEKEIYIQSEQEPQQIIKPVEIIVEEQKKPEPPRQQYEFLKLFKRTKYMKNWSLESASDEQLQAKLRNELAKKNRKCKYKQGLILKKIKKQIINCQTLLQNQYLQTLRTSNEMNTKRVKLNMIISHLRATLHPYLNSQKQSEYCAQKINDRVSQMNYSEITDYDEFRSEMDECQINEIHRLIAQHRAQKRRTTKLITQSQIHQEIEHQATQDTIQLEPIYQIKPDIGADPVLRHIGSIGALQSFRKTFNQRVRPSDPQITQSQEFGRISVISKVSSLKNLRSSQNKYNSTPAQLRNNSSIKITTKKSIEPKISLGKRQGMAAVPRHQVKPFHRVCLDCTASHFLGKEAFLRKGDIVQMQARKTLLSKGRGLQTYISKFY